VIADADVTARLAEALWGHSTATREQAGRTAAALLPVVKQYGDQRAAEALHEAADTLDWSWQWASDTLRPTLRHVEAGLRSRAAALRGETR
jgi:hypothetical protein